MSGTVRVIGEIMLDTVAYASGPLAHGSDTAAHIADHDGGSAANVATWLAQEGIRVELIASVGSDPVGEQALQRLSSAGVHLRVGRHASLPTGRCVVLVAPDGQRTMLPDPGANAVIPAEGIGQAGWQADDHVHVSGYSLMRPGARPAALAAMAAAQSMGLGLSVDASSSAPLVEVGPGAVVDTCPPGTIVFANADEAAALTGETDPDLAAAKLASCGFTAVVKSGARGAVAARGDHMWRVDAQPATVVDTTGAGDAFAAGFLSVWHDSHDMPGSLAAATRLAARAVGIPGARP